MIKTYRIIPLVFILFLFGFTLITGSTAFALNAKICEGDEAFNTTLQNSQPDDWMSKFKAMKDKMICMRGSVKVSGSKPSECAAINPGTTSDPKGKFNLMTDKMKCYKVLLPTETVNSQGAEDEVLETAIAMNAKICEGDEAFNTTLQNSQPDDWMYKFKAMKDKMICMRNAVVKYKGPTSQPECAAINPGTTSDPKGKFNKMTDKMKCYKVLLPTAAEAPAEAQAQAAEAQAAEAQAAEAQAAEAQAVADAQPVQEKIMYGYCVNRCLSDNPTEACTEKCVTTDIVSIEKLQVVIKKQPGVKCYQYTGLACLERFDLNMKSLLTIP
jgi:hypothetical protein